MKLFAQSLAALLLLIVSAPVHAATDISWIETWGTPQPVAPPAPSPFGPPSGSARPAPRPPFAAYPEVLADQTVRMVVRTSAGGSAIRLEFANVPMGETVRIGAVHAALAGPDSAILPGTDHAVTFGG